MEDKNLLASYKLSSTNYEKNYHWGVKGQTVIKIQANKHT